MRQKVLYVQHTKQVYSYKRTKRLKEIAIKGEIQSYSGTWIRDEQQSKSLQRHHTRTYTVTTPGLMMLKGAIPMRTTQKTQDFTNTPDNMPAQIAKLTKQTI